MVNIKNFSVGMLIGISIVSTLSASNQYYNQPNNRQFQQPQQKMVYRPPNQSTDQDDNTLASRYHMDSKPFSYDMANQPRPQSGQRTNSQMGGNNQKMNMQRPSQPTRTCPRITRPQLSTALAGKPFTIGNATYKKVSQGASGRGIKIVESFLGRNQTNYYEGTYIFPEKLTSYTNSKGIKIDSNQLENNGRGYLNDGYCSYIYHSGNKAQEVIVAVTTQESLMRSGHSQGRMQYDPRDMSDEDSMTPQKQSKQQITGKYPSAYGSGQMNTGNRNQVSGRGGMDRNSFDDPRGRNMGNSGQMSDEQLLRSLANKINSSRGNKNLFWGNLTDDEKSMVNDLKAKNDEQEYLSPLENTVIKGIMNMSEPKSQSRSYQQRGQSTNYY